MYKSDYMTKKEKEALALGFIPCEKAHSNTSQTIYRYGCNYCAEASYIVKYGEVYRAVNINRETIEASRIYCPHKECPYKAELDRYRSYADYDRHARTHWFKKLKII